MSMKFNLEAELARCCTAHIREWLAYTYTAVKQDRDDFTKRIASAPAGLTSYLRDTLLQSARSHARRAYDISWEKPGNWEDGRPAGIDAIERLLRSHAAWCRRAAKHLNF